MAKLNTKIVMLEGEQGKDGTNIKSVEKSASDGLTDTYTITLTDGSKSSFNVTNGKGITSISKTGSIGLDDIYTITYNDGSTSTFNVTNGANIKSVEKSASSGLTDTYTTTLTDGSTSTFNVTNGKGISSISKTGAIGLVDTYTITYNDETTSTFTVTNGKGADQIQTQIIPTASIEIGETASKAYNVGEFLVKNGSLYKVTKAISKDDALSGNISADTIAEELSYIGPRLFPYKIKEYTFEYKKAKEYINLTFPLPVYERAFIDGSSYVEFDTLDSYKKLCTPIGYHFEDTIVECYSVYDTKFHKVNISFYSTNAPGTVHVFVRYK